MAGPTELKDALVSLMESDAVKVTFQESFVSFNKFVISFFAMLLIL